MKVVTVSTVLRRHVVAAGLLATGVCLSLDVRNVLDSRVLSVGPQSGW
jgi:hypothetical protein